MFKCFELPNHFYNVYFIPPQFKKNEYLWSIDVFENHANIMSNKRTYKKYW